MRLRDTLRAAPSMAPWLLPARRWGKLTMGDLAARFQSPLLRDAFGALMPAPDGRDGAARDHGVAARRQRRIPAGWIPADGAQPRAPLSRARWRDQLRRTRGEDPDPAHGGGRPRDRGGARRRHGGARPGGHLRRRRPRHHLRPAGRRLPGRSAARRVRAGARFRSSTPSCSSALAWRATSQTSRGASPGCT